MATLYDKQDELVSFLESVVDAIESGVKSSTRYRNTRNLDPGQIKDIAGSPINYLEVLYQGNLTSPEQGEAAPITVEHPFRVSYFYEYEDTDQNETLWRSLTYEDGGIIPKVNETTFIGSGATKGRLMQVEGDVMDVIPFGNDRDLIVNMLTFQVGVIADAP